jgi:catalase
MSESKNSKKLTTEAGAPVSDNQNSKTAGKRGPVLMEDFHMMQKLAHFDRERIPERVVHAKGAGAFGYFEVTDDVSEWTKANFLNGVGKRTPMLARFSTVAGEKGSADTVRDPRGFALKFYTEEGNYDLVGNNTPVFFIRDAIKFPDFIHTQKRNPATNTKDPNAAWDFWSLSPESLHQITILHSDRGIPKTLRHMNGYGSHTFKWVNEEGKAVWIKYHFKTEQGIKNMDVDEATRLAGEDPDYHTRDLYESIENGNPPSWKLYVQIMPIEDADHYKFDPFDVTKVWRHGDYPLIPVGRMVLDQNPKNYFAEIEQAVFSPGNVVPGIGFSPDKMLQGRLFSYADTHRHRVGTNADLLPVNRPINAATNYMRDGAMNLGDNGGNSINYEPNSYDGPRESPEDADAPYTVSGNAEAVPYNDDDHYTQPGDLYRKMNEGERARLVANFVDHMKPVDEKIKLRQIEHFYKVDPELGTRIAKGLGLSVPAVENK